MSTQYCTFQVDHQLFGVEVAKVAEVLRQGGLTPVPTSREVVFGLMNLRGQIVAAVDLRTILGLGPLTTGGSLNVVIRHLDELVSLLVDEIDDVLDLDDVDFEPTPGALPAAFRRVVRGTYKLENRLLLALDVDAALGAVEQAA
jgi:purine-binding chemotaxis protein CheW